MWESIRQDVGSTFTLYWCKFSASTVLKSVFASSLLMRLMPTTYAMNNSLT